MPGKTAFGSVEVMPMVNELPVALGTTFQFASTPLTVTLKGVPADCADGVPVFPDAVPGAAVSPGMRSCTFAKAAGFTVTDELVPVVRPSVISLAVTVCVPASLIVMLKELVPFTSAVLAGRVAVASLLVIPTV